MFQAFATETDANTAEAFFDYILFEYHFQPNEVLDACPDFYENLANILENDWDFDTLKRFADEQFIDYYSRRRKGF